MVSCELARLLSFFSAIYLYSSFETNACSLGIRNIKAFPLALYLAVRPTRCTYVLTSSGMST